MFTQDAETLQYCAHTEIYVYRIQMTLVTFGKPDYFTAINKRMTFLSHNAPFFELR